MNVYSLVPNRRPPPLINFFKIFQPGHSYPNPPAIKFWGKFHKETFMNDVNNHFSFSSFFLICYYLLQKKLHCLEAFSITPSIKFKAIFQPPPFIPTPLLIRFWGFFQPPPDYSNPLLLGTKEYECFCHEKKLLLLQFFI